MIVLIRGGGEVASGVAVRLHRAGFRVAISELEKPTTIRRSVSFAEAIYRGETTVEGITARKLKDPTDSLSILQVFARNIIPVMIDPQGDAIQNIHPTVVVDARMLKKQLELDQRRVTLIVGLGPGFEAAVNCHVVIDTNRGHCLGRVYWQGSIETNSITPPEGAEEKNIGCVIRAPENGLLETNAQIGDHLEEQQEIVNLAGKKITAPIKGVLRGLLHEGLVVQKGMPIAEIDPRDDAHYCSFVSDRSLAVGGGVLEAILSKVELRPYLWK